MAGLGAERYQFVGFCPAASVRCGRSGRSSPAGRTPWWRSSRRSACRARSPRLPALARAAGGGLPELTKLYEEVVRGTATELAEQFAELPKGELVLVLGPVEV